MRDELRDCQCGVQHPWGILRLSEDNVPLYGPRSIESCNNFRPKVDDSVPAFVEDVRELWAQTGDLDPQATLATRAVVARIREMATGVGKYQRMNEQWPEFIGFVISQITSMRGALVRDESKFAHLVAHTDEIVEAMRSVTQLAERLNRQTNLLNEVVDRLDELRQERAPQYSAEALAHFGLMLTDKIWDPNDALGTEYLVASGSQQDAVLIEAEDDDGG